SLNSGTPMGTRLNCAVTRHLRRREVRAFWPGYPHWPCRYGRGYAQVLHTAAVPPRIAVIRIPTPGAPTGPRHISGGKSPTPELGPARHHDRCQGEADANCGDRDRADAAG